MLDILARNAFLSHPNKLFGGDATSRATLDATDKISLTNIDTMRIHLEENEVPGIAAADADQVMSLVCVTSPRVIKDIRTNNTQWKAAQEYAGSTRLFTGEVGMWNGVRFLRTNRMRLFNAGAAVTQTALNGATVAGQGAASTVDSVYRPGQSNSTRYITVDDETGFSVGQYITIHDATAGTAVLESDGTQETRRIVSIDAANNRLALDKPLLKPHADNDYVTNGLNVHASVLMGGPGVVYAVGDEPGVIVPPTYDDLMMINRYGWKGYLKFQLFRPEFFEVVETAASVD